MAIVNITTRTKGPRGNFGIFTEIAARLGVSRAAVSKTNKNPKASARIAAALQQFQKTGRLPEPNDSAEVN